MPEPNIVKLQMKRHLAENNHVPTVFILSTPALFPVISTVICVQQFTCSLLRKHLDFYVYDKITMS